MHSAIENAFWRSPNKLSIVQALVPAWTILRKTGVGPGTLYRHFPTRDKLLEAVYRTEVEKLAAAGQSKVVEASYTPIQEAMRALVKRAIKSGEIRKDVDAIDLLRALVGVEYLDSSPDWQPSAKRLVDILITGSRSNR